MRRRSITLAILLAVALPCASCGSDQTTGAAGTTETSGGANTSGRTQAVQFAQCMRDHGVGAFPDPSASGELTIDAIANDSSIDVDSAGWSAALDACKDLQPSGFTGRKRSSDQQDVALQFAQCIRAHGVTDFPDPTAGAPLIDTTRIPSSEQPGGMDTLNAAMRQCSGYSDKLGVTKP